MDAEGLRPTRKYEKPAVLRLDAPKAAGACIAGSGFGGECMTSGNSAMEECASNGNSAMDGCFAVGAAAAS